MPDKMSRQQLFQPGIERYPRKEGITKASFYVPPEKLKVRKDAMP